MSQEQYDHEFWYTYVKWWYIQIFFSFFKILIFLAKMTQNNKKICLLQVASQQKNFQNFNILCH